MTPSGHVPQNQPYAFAICRLQTLTTNVHQVKTQPLGFAQLGSAQLVEAGQVLVLAVLEKRPPPEGAGRTVDHVDIR